MKTIELQNTKTKNLQSSQEEKKITLFPLCEISHKKVEDPQNDKKKIENFEISNFQNKKHSKFTRRKAKTLFLSVGT